MDDSVCGGKRNRWGRLLLFCAGHALYVLYPDEEVVNSIVELANIVEEGGSLESGEALN